MLMFIITPSQLPPCSAAPKLGETRLPLAFLLIVLPIVSVPGGGDIHDAAARGDLAKVKELIALNPSSVTAMDDYAQTPLHVACECGHLQVVQFLLANGASVNARAYNKFTPLHLAREPAIVRALLANKPDLTLRDSAGHTPLEGAASEVALGEKDQAKWREIVKLLLDAGAHYDIHSAIYFADLARVQAILKMRPERANRSPKDSEAPLRLAARKGRLEICKLLLKYRADPDDFEGGNGIPIICDAVRHPQAVESLLHAGADVKEPITFQGAATGVWVIEANATALHYAAEEGNVDSARLLLNRGVKIDSRDDAGQTPLYVAAAYGQAAMIRFLLQRGADPHAQTKNGAIPLDVACSVKESDGEKDEVIRILKEATETGKRKGKQ